MYKLFILFRSRTLYVLFLLLISINTFAQKNQKIIGKVVSDSDGEPIIGATIFSKETNRGTVSDLEGNFVLQNSSKIRSLRISYVGYETRNIPVKVGQIITVRLKENVSLIDEVVVVGYGTQKKKEVTGAVGSVGNDDLMKTSSADLGTALQGLVSGVNVQASSGEPGSMANVQIRGIGSVSGNNQPLYVVDGIPYDGVPYINNNEIERMDILKDAASASIYGTRASNGVVLITTKQGKTGQMKVNFNAYYGIQNLQHTDIPICNSVENTYVNYIRNNQKDGNIGFMGIFYNPFGAKYDINWLNELLVKNSPIQEYSLGISGGSDAFTYNIIATYFNQNGTMINSDFNQGSLRFNSSFKKNKIKILTSISGNVRNKRKFPGNVISYAIAQDPYMYIPTDGTTDIFVSEDDPTTSSASQAAQKMANLSSRFVQRNKEESNSVNTNLQLQYNILTGLTLNAKLAYLMGNTFYSEYKPQMTVYMSDGSLSNQSEKFRSSLLNKHSNNYKYSMEYAINYAKKIQEKHSINLLANVSYEKSFNRMFQAYNTGLMTNISKVMGNTTGNPVVNGLENNEVLMGALGRLQYNYKSKYMLSLSSRFDGTSRFSSSNRWGIFPSVMLGWNVSDESFWKPMKNTISTFRLRASRGMTGNNRFNSLYMAQTLLNEGYDYVFGEVDTRALGMIQKALSNENLKWETSVSNNFGLDLSFFKNKITLGVDAYIANKKNMLFDVSVPPSVSGVSNQTIVMNVGDMKNEGIELDLKYKYIKKNNKLTLGINWSKNTNKITKISDNTDVIYIGPAVNNIKMLALRKGYPAGSFFLIPTDGVIKNDVELKEYQEKTGEVNSHVGSLRYVDTDGVKGINDNDRVYYGSGTPKWESGFNINYSYKNFDISMQWYLAMGAKVMNVTKQIAYEEGAHKDLLYQWSTNNPTSDIPLEYVSKGMSYRIYSDYFLEDGDFLRLRNVTLGYNFPKNFTQKLGVKNFRLFAVAQNMLTLTKYTGFDPEVGGNGLSTKGIDNGTYPVCGQVRFGLQLSF